MIDLDKLEALARKATPGPWVHRHDPGNPVGYQHGVKLPGEFGAWIADCIDNADRSTDGGVAGERNAALIAAANPAAVLELIALARQADGAETVAIPLVSGEELLARAAHQGGGDLPPLPPYPMPGRFTNWWTMAEEEAIRAYACAAIAARPAIIPHGWRIKQISEGRIAVEKEGIGGYAAESEADSIASSILHALASDMLTAQPVQQPAPVAMPAASQDSMVIGFPDPEAVFAQFCEIEGYPSDGDMDEALRKAFYEGTKLGHPAPSILPDSGRDATLVAALQTIASGTLENHAEPYRQIARDALAAPVAAPVAGHSPAPFGYMTESSIANILRMPPDFASFRNVMVRNTPVKSCSTGIYLAHVPAASVQPATITLDGHQLRMALEFINPDGLADRDQLDNDLTFGVRQHRDDDGKVGTGMCCWNDDTDGVLPLDGEYEGHAAVQPDVVRDAALLSAIRNGVPLEEPVSIAKAMMAQVKASACLDKGLGPLAMVQLVNIQVQPWMHTKETATSYADGFNRGVEWLRSSIIEYADKLAPANFAKAGELSDAGFTASLPPILLSAVEGVCTTGHHSVQIIMNDVEVIEAYVESANAILAAAKKGGA